jgi:hypothetical protein
MTASYEVTVRGRLSAALVLEFAQLDVSAVPKPTETVLCGELPDQAALYGLLRRVESFGLELVEVREVRGRAALPGPAAP